MTRIIQAFKVTSYLEISISAIAIAFYVYYNRDDWDILVLILFMYMCMTLANIIGLRTISVHKKGFKAKDELIIPGHIANCIKLLGLISLIALEGVFFAKSYKAVNRFNQIGVLYYLGTASFLLWNICSLFNFIAYILISRTNKKFGNKRFGEVETMTSVANNNNFYLH